jgi:hypothetical protein
MFVSIDLLTLEPNKFNVTVLYKCASCVSPVFIFAATDKQINHL